MKRFFFNVLASAALIMTGTQCSTEEPAPGPDPDNSPKRHELPAGKGMLKVLAIGNSFVEDPLAYLDDIVQASGIDCDRLCVYSAVVGYSSLQYWADRCQNDDSVTITRSSGKLDMPVTQAPLNEILNQDWDVVTVQQVSTQAQDAQSLSQPLPYLVSQIRKCCPNKDVVIAFQQVWSYWWYENGTSLDHWEIITDVVKTTFSYGVDMIIPTGTAIQNARATELNTPHGLTRDSIHLCYGIGRYVAACTWFETRIAPVFAVSVSGNTAIHDITEDEQANSLYETAAVTSLNRSHCQQCAINAVKNPYIITAEI